MTIEEIKSNYTPKPGFTVYAYQSTHTGNYIAAIYEKVEVNRFRKESMEAYKKIISVKNIDDYFEQVKPYLDERTLN